MRAWRISNHADLSGLGGKYKAGRWNRLGTPIVYCADHPALAMLEMLVHFDPQELPDNYRLLEIAIPDGIEAAEPELADGWRDDEVVTRNAFESFRRSARSPVLRVPSIIVPNCSNLLLNPEHQGIAEIRVVSVETHPLDTRFLR